MFSESKNNHSNGKAFFAKKAAAKVTALFFAFSSIAPAWAGTLSPSPVPMGSGTSFSVKPNIMLVLDNSGSMAWGFLPDYVGQNTDTTSCQGLNCFGNTRGAIDDWIPQSSSSWSVKASSSGRSGYDLFAPGFANLFNKQYYNPNVRYEPPYFNNGSGVWQMPDSPPTAAFKNPYKNPTQGADGGITAASSDGTTNLTTSYPVHRWCDGTSTSTASCIGDVDGTEFAAFDPNRPVVQVKAGGPHYYDLTREPVFCSGLTNAVSTAGRNISHSLASSATCHNRAMPGHLNVWWGPISQNFEAKKGYADISVTAASLGVPSISASVSETISVGDSTLNNYNPTTRINEEASDLRDFIDSAFDNNDLAISSLGSTITIKAGSNLNGGTFLSAGSCANIVYKVKGSNYTVSASFRAANETAISTGTTLCSYSVPDPGRNRVRSGSFSLNVNVQKPDPNPIAVEPSTRIVIKNGSGTTLLDQTATASPTIAGNTLATRIELANGIISSINGSGGGYSAELTTTCSSGPASCVPVVRVHSPLPNETAKASEINAATLSLTNNNVSVSRSYASGSSWMAEDRKDFPTFNYSDGVKAKRVSISSTKTYERGMKRTDCPVNGSNTGRTCSGAQELQNFANWYSYYRDRMKSMKAAVSTTFATENTDAPDFRVGLMHLGEATSNTLDDHASAASNDLFSAEPQVSLSFAAKTTKAQVAAALNGQAFESPHGAYSITAVEDYWSNNVTVYVRNSNKIGSKNTRGKCTPTIPTGGGTTGGFSDFWEGTGQTGINAGFNICSFKIKGKFNLSKFKLNVSVYDSINSSSASELAVRELDNEQMLKLFSRLYNLSPSASTPLRPALARAGRYYGGKLKDLAGDSLSGTTTSAPAAKDPIQYTCQINTALVVSDGYWNGEEGTSLTGKAFGDMDGPGSVYNNRYPFFDAAGASQTLSDVALYYHDTDLRENLMNDAPEAGSGMKHQRMNTYVLSFGVSGVMDFNQNYMSGGSTDYNKILAGEKNWPSPFTFEEHKGDDMWHAAVNGRGQFFSASEPDQIVDNLRWGLKNIAQIVGAASAAATSNLEPVAGDNFAYTASYRTAIWDGNLAARRINLTTGALSSVPIWEAREKLDDKLSFSSSTPPKPWEAGRKVYTKDPDSGSSTGLIEMTWENAQAIGFDNHLSVSGLAQCGASADANCPGVGKEQIFEFLMGRNLKNLNLRYREHALGDIVFASPVYVQKPSFGYEDSGYSNFKVENASRAGVVYAGANDGFLHAFNADSGEELWAYMPSVLGAKMNRLASTNYSHDSFVDGPIIVSDAYFDGQWRTVLVGGLGNAGTTTSAAKAYYALDVTDPGNPKLLWEFSHANMGLSFGNPIITKSAGDGKWYALLASGYNNGASNKLFVVNLETGVLAHEISTSSETNAGLAKLNNWVDDGYKNNTTRYVYGGDLNGDLWRFDLMRPKEDGWKMAELGEPITVKPELAEVNGARMVFFGSGQFIQLEDKEETTGKGIYGIKDPWQTVSKNPRESVSAPASIKGKSTLVQRTLTAKSISGDANVYRTTCASSDTANCAPIDWSTKDGWWVPLPDAGERVNVDPKLQLGTLVVLSNVPETSESNGSCVFGGYSWINYLDIKTGTFVSSAGQNPDQIASKKLGGALAVGVNIVKLPNGKLAAIVTMTNNEYPSESPPKNSSSNGVRRVSWRELILD